MPPKVKFTREEIIRAALDIVRETGPEGLTARSLAARLGCSVKPIFGLFRSMEEVQQEVLAAGYRLYGQTIAQAMEAGKYPPYKASGMAYIAFAQQEKPLFRLLFMRDRSHEDASPRLGDDVEPLLDLIQQAAGISRESARMFHLEMWIYVHGIAAMAATSFLDWDTELISASLTGLGGAMFSPSTSSTVPTALMRELARWLMRTTTTWLWRAPLFSPSGMMMS